MIDVSQLGGSWMPPNITDEIPHGDMPGDKVSINEGHIKKANVIFPRLLERLPAVFAANPSRRAVVSVYGGSGVGKSEIASILTYYLNDMDVRAYTLSGDNYPHRIPHFNDAERLRIFRVSGIHGLMATEEYAKEHVETLAQLMKSGAEADPDAVQAHPWLAEYQRAGRAGLNGYLGTQNEIDFSELSLILGQFKAGADELYLKRMGREETQLWYDRVDVANLPVLVVEWTHGNNNLLNGVDIPIFLHSTPQETLEHRRLRARDGSTDSQFTAMVLELEQQQLASQAQKAEIIVSKHGELLTLEQYRRLEAE